MGVTGVSHVTTTDDLEPFGSSIQEVGGACPFGQTLLKSPLARSKSNLDSTFTIVKIKTCI